MTEDEWNKSVTPNALLHHLHPWRRHRKKLRLYVCAWYRLHWQMLNNQCRYLIEQCERIAFGNFNKAVYAAAKQTVVISAQKEFIQTGHGGLFQVGSWLLQDLRLDHLPGWEGMPASTTWFEGTEEQRQTNDKEHATLRGLQMTLLRDIFGNPYRRVIIDPATLRGETLRQIVEVYQDRQLPGGSLSNDRLKSLGMSLESIGGIDSELLSHLQSPEPHILGCWAVDLLRQALPFG